MKYLGLLIIFFSISAPASLAEDLAKAFNITYQAGCRTGIRHIVKRKGIKLTQKDADVLNAFCTEEADKLTKKTLKTSK